MSIYYLFAEMKVVNGPILITFATSGIFLKEHLCNAIFKGFHLCILLNFLSFILIINVLHFYF